jgi:hypothetical protein
VGFEIRDGGGAIRFGSTGRYRDASYEDRDGGQDGAAECTRMVLEKFDATAAAHTAGALALAGGKSLELATKLAMAPVRRRVRTNHLRLMRGS